jgi:hypothetical protein
MAERTDIYSNPENTVMTKVHLADQETGKTRCGLSVQITSYRLIPEIFMACPEEFRCRLCDNLLHCEEAKETNKLLDEPPCDDATSLSVEDALEINGRLVIAYLLGCGIGDGPMPDFDDICLIDALDAAEIAYRTPPEHHPDGSQTLHLCITGKEKVISAYVYAIMNKDRKEASP